MVTLEDILNTDVIISKSKSHSNGLKSMEIRRRDSGSNAFTLYLSSYLSS